MVRTRRGTESNRSDEGKGDNNLTQIIIKKRKYTRKTPQGPGFDSQQSPLSAPQFKTNHSEAGNCLSDVLKHHLEAGNFLSDVLKHHRQNTYEHGTSGAARKPRRAIDYGKPYLEDNTESNLTYIQHANQLPDKCSKDEVMDQTTTPQYTPSTVDVGSPYADVAAIGANDVALNINNQEEGRAATSTRNSQPTQSLNVTEIAAQMNLDDESEVDSFACDNTLVSVRGYKIKPEYVDCVVSIFSKYGDIGAKCSDKPVSIRSFYMEYPCVVLEKLEHTEFVNITKYEIEDILASLSHLESENVNVGWLKERVQAIYEAHMAVPMLRSCALKQRFADKKSKIQKLEEDLEAYTHAYAIKKAELADLEKMMYEAKKVISEEMEEVNATKTMIANYKANLKYIFNLKSLGQSLI